MAVKLKENSLESIVEQDGLSDVIQEEDLFEDENFGSMDDVEKNGQESEEHKGNTYIQVDDNLSQEEIITDS